MELPPIIALFSRKVVFPVNIRLLWIAVTAPPLIQQLTQSNSSVVVVMYECVPCQSDVSVIHCKCSAKVVMEGTVN